MSEATTLLKTLKPVAKAVKIKRVNAPDGPTGLLDGGATNALRRGTPKELAEADPVVVELAHGSVELKQHALTGTILTEHAVEPIVPLRGLIDLGFVIKWSTHGCEIKHPSRGTIQCWLRNGCPVVSEKHALGLIHDIESLELAKRIPSESPETVSETAHEWWSQRFPNVPKRIWRYMKGQGVDTPGVHLPWNRAQRRRHAQAKAIVIHLYAGEASKDWSLGWPADVEMITLDVRDGQNVHDAATWAYLWRLAASGRVVAVLGGPPCRTVSRLLEKTPGPPRLRSRNGPERFGFEHLNESQQQKTDSDTALYLKQLGLYMHAHESWDGSRWPHMKHVANRVGFMLESPQDPKTYLQNGEGDESASFWAWDETRDFLEAFQPNGMELISFDQGAFGHTRKKPTTCMTNLPDMKELDGCRSGERERHLAVNLDERLNQTASWSLWAPGLRAAIKTSLLVLVEWYGISPPKLSKSLGLDQWKQHINQGHQPYRRDCRTCILNMAGSKPHRRREHAGSSAWTMSVDLVNLPKARDLATKKVVRYGLVATALVPVFDSPPGDETSAAEKPLVAGDVSSDAPQPMETVDACWGEGLDEKEYSLQGDEKTEENPEGDEGEKVKDHDGGDGNETDYEPSIMGEDELKEWESKSFEKVVGELSQPVKVRHVTLMEPVESRNVKHVMPAMDALVTRMRYMGVCVTRIHSDRAKELLARKFRSWVAQRNMMHTFTAGDDPQSNGHCEAEVNQLKRRTRLLLHMAGQDNTHWPQAMRFATEERLRQQMELLGSPVQKMLPYNSLVLVKRKRWHDKGNLLAQPFVETRLLCPSPDMTSGWLVRTTKDQHVLHAREAILPDPLGDQAQLQLEEDLRPGKPHLRLWHKQPPPGPAPMKLPPLPRLDRGGESSLVLDSQLEKIPENEPRNEVVLEVDGEHGDNGDEMLGIFDEIDQENLREAPRFVKGLNTNAGSGGGGNPKNPENFGLGSKSRVVAKLESLDCLEKCLGWKHQTISSSLQDLLDVVPTTKSLGEICGADIQWLQGEKERLENDLFLVRDAQNKRVIKMCGLQTDDVMAVNPGEVLQTTTIPLNEVRNELGEWKDAMMKEYNSLVHETKAIEPVDLSMLNQEAVEFVPGKLVTVRKAGPNGGKKKCRAVVCGNLLQSDLDPAPGNLYASGADGILIRATLAHSVQMGWGAGITDIRTAFLLAPRPKPQDAREVIVVPPKILVEAKVCSPSERWRVHNALYGFTSSPAHWAVHRDQVMSGFKWKMDGCDFSLKRTEEGNLWKIMKHGHGDAEPTCEGHVIVYVDDIMALANDNVRNSFFDRLKKEWKCSDVETVDKNEWIRFCGFELKRHDDGVSLMVGQKSYTAELLKRHEHVSPKSCPMPKLDSSETDETDITTPDVRAAQAITGELLWLSVRSRPDIAYAVSVMGRNVTRKPRWVQQLGQHVLGFLCNTPETCLLYRPCNKDHGAHGTLQVPRHEKLIEAFADISFAPQGDRSHQGIILCAAGSPIQWEATRQAFHTMSTAESELVGYCEATTMLKSAEALLKVIHGSCNTGDGLDGFEKVIYGDNSSALSILMNPDGGWRTRHLRLRSSCLRELLKSDPQTWKVRHQRGVDLPADMLTKPITLLRDWVKFWHFLGFHVDASIPKYDPENTPQKTSKGSSKTTATSGPDETKGSDDVVTKVKVIVAMAALAVASSAAGRADVRLACATAAAACAGWLACNWHPAPSSADRSKEICLDGREVEKPSRAIGLKSEKDARGDEPAKEKPPRENEPGGINPQIRTKKCVRSPREDEPGENSFGKVWDEPLKNQFWAHRTYESQRDFWDSNPEEGPVFGDFVAGNSCGMAHNSFESVGGDSEDAVEMLQPLLADTYHCPTGCPKVPAVRLAAMAPKMSKPAPPLPPQEPGFAAPKAAPKPAAVRRKAPPMMLQCAAAMGAPSSSSEIRGPYIGALPKFPPARRDAEMAQKAAGGTMLDGMPRHGPWLDSRYLQPNTTGKKDSWSVAKCGEEIFLVKVHKSPRKQRFHPLHRSAPIEAQFLTGERSQKPFL